MCHIVRYHSLAALHGHEDGDAHDEETMECQGYGVSVRWDCLDPPTLSATDGIFGPRCIGFRPEHRCGAAATPE